MAAIAPRASLLSFPCYAGFRYRSAGAILRHTYCECASTPYLLETDMDRRRIELQLRAILVIYRGEKNHRSAETMKGIRERAEILFRDLEASVEPYPDLKERLADARHELDGLAPSEEQAR